VHRADFDLRSRGGDAALVEEVAKRRLAGKPRLAAERWLIAERKLKANPSFL
jgi:hypothetical protein